MATQAEAQQFWYWLVSQGGGLETASDNTAVALANQFPGAFSVTWNPASLFDTSTVLIRARNPPNWGGTSATTSYSVRDVQAALNKIYPNLTPLVVDGIAGPKTRERVSYFQGGNGLPATGIIDNQTAVKILAIAATINPFGGGGNPGGDPNVSPTGTPGSQPPPGDGLASYLPYILIFGLAMLLMD